MTWDLALAFVVVLAVAIVDAQFLERSGDVDQEDRVEDLKQRYEEGELTLTEFEERVALVLDGDAQVLRERLERVDGVGPETSAALASRFETVEAVREASRGDLEAVHGVGPATSSAIVEAF